MMHLTKDKKMEIIADFGSNKHDTGNTAVQVALLTGRIRHLTEHCKEHRKDHSSRRSLLKLVGHRRRLLRYLQNTELERYRSLLKRLNIRK